MSRGRIRRWNCRVGNNFGREVRACFLRCFILQKCKVFRKFAKTAIGAHYADLLLSFSDCRK